MFKKTQAGVPAEQAVNVLRALGGIDNLTALDACITRLRVTVKKPSLVSQADLQRLGAAGILADGHHFQAVFGMQSNALKRKILEIVRSSGNENCFGLKHSVYAPLSGEVVPLSEVPDPVFAERMMGDGFAIRPVDGLMLAPVSGTVLTAFWTKHAVALMTENGLEILIHVGISTVKLEGNGFELLVKEGDAVTVGTPLLNADLAYINTRAQSSITPVVFTNLNGQLLKINMGKAVAGQTVVCTVHSG